MTEGLATLAELNCFAWHCRRHNIAASKPAVGQGVPTRGPVKEITMGLRSAHQGSSMAHERTPLIIGQVSPRRDDVDEVPDSGNSDKHAVGAAGTSHRKFILMAMIVLACVGGGAVYVGVVVAGANEGKQSPAGEGFANGAVATDAAVCSQIGVDILKRGGALHLS